MTSKSSKSEVIGGGSSSRSLHSSSSPSSHHSDHVVIYTDGACHGNGQDNSRGGYGIYAPNHPHLTQYGPLASDGPRHTNQRAELEAIKQALKKVPANVPLEIRTDSKYSMGCVGKWGDSWEDKNYQVDKKNLDLVKNIRDQVNSRLQPTKIVHLMGCRSIDLLIMPLGWVGV